MIVKPDFWDYLVFYQGEDEADYDGVHDGGIKGIAEEAPDTIKQSYFEYCRAEEEALKNGIRR